jgi:hypothetical protein
MTIDPGVFIFWLLALCYHFGRRGEHEDLKR